MLYVLTKDGKELFSGSRHDVKHFLRKNNVKQYILKDRFTEKVTVTEEDSPTNPLSEPETPEGFFNKVFDE